MNMSVKEARVWAYLVDNRKATAEDVAINCDVSEDFAARILARIASPNWREEYVAPKPTEGLKFDQGKARYDLLPPEFLDATAQVLTFGANKYGERNWENGMKWGRPFAALMRHMWAWWKGEKADPETGMSHLWHACACLAFLIAFEERSVGTDDRSCASK